jgi:hypothetical protein
MNFLGNQKFLGSRTETKTYEQIHIVFNHRRARHGAHVFLPTAGDDCDDETSSHRSVTNPEAAGAAQDRWRGKEKSAKDRGLSI